METYVIKAPEGFEAVATVVGGVTSISFIPKVVEKKLPTTLEETIPFIPESCYYIDTYGEIETSASTQDLREANMLTSKEYAEAFLALMQLVRFRDIWNEDWIADWAGNCKKYSIVFYENRITPSTIIGTSTLLVFKTAVLRDKFSVTFKDLIETAKPLL